ACGISMTATQPPWLGEPMSDGQCLLLHAEQGFGDAIHFVRYVPLAADRCMGARIVLQCPLALTRLFEGIAGVDRVVFNTNESPLPADKQCPLLSLPYLFGTTIQTIPAKVPYLYADRLLAGRWGTRLAPFSDKLKVGIAWAGSSKYKNDRNR